MVRPYIPYLVSSINQGLLGTSGCHVEHFVQMKRYKLKQPGVEHSQNIEIF
jgi:hypothetical protein